MINRLIEPTTGTIEIDGRDVTGPGPGRAAPRHRLRHPAGRAVPAPDDRDERRDRAAAVRRVQGDRALACGGAAGAGRARPRDVRRPLPAPALRRPAAAGRRGPRAGGRPAGAADGRAVRRGRPGGADPAAGRVPAPAARARQDGRAGHPRHRRGGADGRPGGGLRGRRAAGAVRHPRASSSRTRPTTSSPTSWAPTKGLRRLAVTPIDPAHLEPLDGVSTGDLAGAIGVDATLEEALAALLRDDKQVVGVRDGAHLRRRAHPQRHPPRPAGVAATVEFGPHSGCESRLARRVDANDARTRCRGRPNSTFSS